MDSVSRPLIALLLSTVAVFAVWFVALKPSSSGSGGAGASNQGALTSAITKAHQAVATSAAASVAHGGTVLTAKPAGARGAATAATAATPLASSTAPRTATKTASRAHTPTTPTTPTTATTPAHRANTVTRALNANKTLALLFYNPAAADDRAVRKELAAVPVHRGRVVKLAVPLSELARYQAVTNSVMVSVSPTLVLIDSAHHASTLVGFADRFEIAQRVADALASP